MKSVADIGGFGGMKEERKRLNDLSFTEKVKSAPYEELVQMMKNFSHQSAPRWKVVCILRAMAKLNTPQQGQDV